MTDEWVYGNVIVSIDDEGKINRHRIEPITLTPVPPPTPWAFRRFPNAALIAALVFGAVLLIWTLRLMLWLY